MAAEVGVVYTPEITKRTLTPRDRFMVLGSDGVRGLYVLRGWCTSPAPVPTTAHAALAHHMRPHTRCAARPQLFEFLSSQEVVDFVASRLKRGMDAELIAKQLFAMSRKVWMSTEGVVDDITVMIAQFEWETAAPPAATEPARAAGAEAPRAGAGSVAHADASATGAAAASGIAARASEC